jgi:hypothetical protein
MMRLEQIKDGTARLKKIVPDLTLDRNMVSLSTSVGRENGRTDVILRKIVRGYGLSPWWYAGTCSRDLQRLGCVDPDGLWGHRVCPLDVPPPIPPHRFG